MGPLGIAVGCCLALHAAYAAQVRELRPRSARAPALAEEAPKVPGFKKPWVIDEKRCATGFFRVGCYDDMQKDERRYYKDHVAKEDQESMTVDVCWNFCRNITGAQYFGLRQGRECYCTPAFDSFSGGNDDSIACDVPCEGNSMQMCGGERHEDMYEMHDCNNLPAVKCKKPPASVPNAKPFFSKFYRMETPCKNAVKDGLDTKGNHMCEIECEEGFYVLPNSHIECKEFGNRLTYSWAQLAGQAACIAVTCGPPPPKEHSIVGMSEIKYPDSATYTCDIGYSINGTAHGDKSQQVKCLSTGAFAEVKQCMPVGCGTCPTGGKYQHAIPRIQNERVYRDVCPYDCEKGYTLDSRADGQTSFEISCQLTGEFEEPSNCLPVVCGQAPDVPFAKAAAGSEDPKVYVFPEQVDYACDKGYSLDGIPGGPSTFQVQCGANAQFSKPPTCKPVLVGNPPFVNNSVYVDRPYVYGESCTYTCNSGYSLDGSANGETVVALFAGADGKWSGAPPKCLPVVCGPPPTLEFASVNGTAPASMDFATPALTYACAPGYSTSVSDDIWTPTKNAFIVNCMANGQFDVKKCVNIDDCIIRNCGAHGTCEDLPSPVAEPLDSYNCNCESGYETTLWNSTQKEGALMKRCTDINDCPAPNEEACGGRNAMGAKRGECTDLLNAYKCTCGSGYQVSLSGSNQTCAAISCGTVPSKELTTCEPNMYGQEVNFDTPAWTVSCEQGYSLDGTALGAVNYQMKCTSTGALSAQHACFPMSCGATPFVANADMSPKLVEIVYKESVTYTCDEGYALKGDPKGLRVFEIACLNGGVLSVPDTEPGGAKEFPTEAPPADGQPKAGTPTTTTTPLACLPVRCGVAPHQDYATWNVTQEYVYPQGARYYCFSGYSIDGSTGAEKDTYSLSCQSSGEFGTGETCQRVQCPAPPTMPHASYEPSQDTYRYEDKVTYTIDPGHEVVKPDGTVVNGTFECVCDANGKFNGTCAMDLEVRAHDCGPAPDVAYATVTGSTLFGGMLTATADTGFTLDGTASGNTTFTFYCQADGRFSERQEFFVIKCGLCAAVPNSDEVELNPANHTVAFIQGNGHGHVGSHKGQLKVRSLSGVEHGTFRRKAKRSGMRLFETVYGDEVTYTCQEGYRAASGDSLIPTPVDPVPQTLPGRFTVACALHGDLVVVSPSTPANVACVPVTCDVTMPQERHAVKVPRIVNDGDFDRRVYKETQPYKCVGGYSLDGKPSGEVEFIETCQADGTMSQSNACIDIDYCLISQCGEHGKCTDGWYSYTCECEPGYQVELVDARWQKCVPILECETQNGQEFCSVGGGVCIDGHLSYTCECKEGYENKIIDRGLDSCAAKMCPAAPIKEHAMSSTQGQKLFYTQTAKYECDPGYSTTGKIEGSTSFTITCAASGELEGVQDCKPVECSKASTIRNGDIVGADTVVYAEAVKYECHVGYTTSGYAAGDKNFSTPCLTSGVLAEPLLCNPVSCGTPLVVPSGSASKTGEQYFGDEVLYACADGYTMDGQASGTKTFTAKCEANGTFSGMASCSAVTCGAFPGVEKGLSPVHEFKYPQEFSVNCLTGYTVDADPAGESTFVVKCATDGKFAGVKECKPVTCGTPAETLGSTSSDGAKVYMEVATWSCKPGFSTNGFPTGGNSYQKVCDAVGHYAGASPSDCKDIDYCTDAPCGANGVCKDAGVGVPYPGYSCTCFEGFEVKPNPDGSETCSEDDCTGQPCGEGGACTDLSKVGAPEGTYSCTCESGYSLVEPDGKYTCHRNSCGTLPKVTNAQLNDDGTAYTVKAWKDKSVEIEPFTGQPILNSFDVATYRCAAGYSTSGTATPEAMDFSITCESYGSFSRLVNADTECRPVACPDPFLPSISKAVVINKEGSASFTYGQKAKFQCDEGYTTTGYVDGPVTFELECLSTGAFSSEHPQCYPISCGDVPVKPNAFTTTKNLTFGEKVVYTCNPGFYLDGSATAPNSVEATCALNGTLTYTQPCEPVVCPAEVPPQPNADVVIAPPKPVTLGMNYVYKCKDGFSKGGVFGTDPTYSITCMPNGQLSGSTGAAVGGPAGGMTCQPSLIPVEGVVSDASVSLAAGGGISGARLDFISSSTVATYTFYSSAGGAFSAKVPVGTYTVKASKGSYIDREKTIVVAAAVSGWEISLSKVLSNDDWRIVLTWGKDPVDLDSHTYFGCDLQQHVSVQDGKFAVSDRAGGLEVKLDRDAALGYGPETTTITKANKCETVGCCLIQFKVNHFSGSGSLGGSGATVTVYKGNAKVTAYSVPPCVGDKKWWTVFTIDATKFENKLYEGDMRRAPYITDLAIGTTSWATSFDSAQWSEVSAPSGRMAIAYGLNVIDAANLHTLDSARYYEVRGGSVPAPLANCQDVDWKVTNMWASCPTGSYVKGLYRIGSKYDAVNDGLEQITKARCCFPEATPGAPVAWGACQDQSMPGVGDMKCAPIDGKASALAGMHASLSAGTAAVTAVISDGSVKHQTVGGQGVFLEAKYVALGVASTSYPGVGKFGIPSMPPAGFATRANGYSGVGMLADDRGFAADPNKDLRLEFFLPGSPAESFKVGVKRGGSVWECSNCGQTVSDISADGFGIVRTEQTIEQTGYRVKVTQDTSLGWSDKFFKTVVKVVNVGSTTVENFRFMRTVDPDNTVDKAGNYVTNQRIEATVAADGYAMVSAISTVGDPYYSASGGKRAVLAYFSTDPRAKASYGGWNLDPGSVWNDAAYENAPPKGATITTDAWMAITFNIANLGPGQETTITYYTSLDARPVSEIISVLKAASKPVLKIDQFKCCALKPAGLIPGPPTCSALMM